MNTWHPDLEVPEQYMGALKKIFPVEIDWQRLASVAFSMGYQYGQNELMRKAEAVIKISANNTQDMSGCVCGEINARNCPVHQEEK